MREIEFKIRTQGSVKLYGSKGYMLVGDENVVCFYIDPIERAYIGASSYSEEDCPVIFLYSSEDDEFFTEIEFCEFPGWKFHSGGGGKVISVALVRREALDAQRSL